MKELVRTFYGRDPEGGWTPYLTRLFNKPLTFHIFHRGDADPHCHDHTAEFWTFPLVDYIEEVLDGDGITQPNYVHAFMWHYRSADYRHRVLHPASGKGRIWTIVWWGKRVERPWGFWVNNVKVPWRTYIYGDKE